MNVTINFNPTDSPKAAEAFAVFLMTMSAPPVPSRSGAEGPTSAAEEGEYATGTPPMMKESAAVVNPCSTQNLGHTAAAPGVTLCKDVQATPPPPPPEVTPEPLPLAPADDTRPTSELDVNGVPCDRNYCGPSKKADGTWARKRGTDEAAFTKWYASQLPTKGAAPVAPPPPPAAAPVAPPPPPSATPGTPVGTVTDPTLGVGQFMTWVSGLQAAGRLTQAQVKEAFTEERILQPMLFNKALNTSELLGRLVKNITAKVGQ